MTDLPRAGWFRLRQWSGLHLPAPGTLPAGGKPPPWCCSFPADSHTSAQKLCGSAGSVPHAKRFRWQLLFRGSGKYRPSFLGLPSFYLPVQPIQRSNEEWLACTTCSATESSSTPGSLLFCTNIRYSMLPSGPFTGLKSSPRTTKPFAAA